MRWVACRMKKVDIWNGKNGARIHTYALEAPRGSRTIGDAVRRFEVGESRDYSVFLRRRRRLRPPPSAHGRAPGQRRPRKTIRLNPCKPASSMLRALTPCPCQLMASQHDPAA